MSEDLTVQPWAGRELRNTLLFMAVPGLLAVLITLLEVRLPTAVLYSLAVSFGLILLLRSLHDPEWLLAIAVCYLPLSKQYVLSLGAGLNGTNILLALMIISLVWVCRHQQRSWLLRHPGSRTVGWLFALTVLSGVTVILGPHGLSYLIEDVVQEYKGFLDQLVFFFLVLNLIKDGRMARRLCIYMIVSGVLVAALGTQELIEKMGRGSMEASRVAGPPNQPNDFGAVLIYSMAPLIGVFLVYMWRIRSWLLLPYFALTLKVLLATFSRGAYLAVGATGLIAGYVKGKWFLLLGAIVGTIVLISAPQLIPDALTDRIANTRAGDRYTSEIDASSQTRFILWKAGLQVTLENPLLGVGFKVFPLIKSEYTEQEVKESDNHNMYLWISSQMGIPALLVFLWLLYSMYRMGVRVYRGNPQSFAKALGLGAAAMAAGAAAVNMFGSRMTNLEVTCFFWATLAIVSHLVVELEAADACNSRTAP